MKFSIKDLFCKCVQSAETAEIWSHSLKKYLIENFIFCAVCPLMNNVVEIKIKLHSKYTNRTWVGKLTDQKINQQTIFVYDPYLKTTKLWYWFITLILIYKLIAGNMSSLNCKQKLRGLPEDKNSNKRKVLICEFHKKLLIVIREKAESIHKWDWLLLSRFLLFFPSKKIKVNQLKATKTQISFPLI